MAVTRVWRAAESASGSKTAKGGSTYSAPYHVTVEYPTDGVVAIINYFESAGLGTGTPFVYGDESDADSICDSIAPRRKPNSTLEWSCVLGYVPKEDQEDKKDDEDNPSEDPSQWRMSHNFQTATFAVPVEKAWNVDPFPIAGDSSFTRAADTLGPVVNSAGVVLDPPLMRTQNELIWRVTGFLDEYVQAWTESYIDTINGEQLTWHHRLTDHYGFSGQLHEPFTVKCTSASAVCRWWRDIVYWEYSYEFRFRDRATEDIDIVDGWLELVLDRGVSRRAGGGDPDGAGGTISSSDLEDGMARVAPILDKDGRRVPELVLLDGAGQPATGETERTGVYFRWRVNPTAWFTAIPLDLFETL